MSLPRSFFRGRGFIILISDIIHDMMRNMVSRKHNLFVFSNKQRVFSFLKILGIVFLGFFILGLTLFIWYLSELPRPEKFSEGEIPQSTKIYDNSGNVLLYEIAGEEKRTIVSLNEVPSFLIKAVLAAEDKNFYEHRGLDFKGIGRAILTDLRIKSPLMGGSTISQQLVRSYFLTRKKTIERKTKEVILAIELERRYSKDQIMEWYLNLIPFGGNIYGIEAASQSFFGKHISDISLEEAAILAAVIKAPSTLSPYGKNKNELLGRKDYVLERMEKEGFISKEQKEIAQKEEINFNEILNPIKAPHFVIYVKDYLEKKYGSEFLTKKGLKVYTTLDFGLQTRAEEIIGEGVKTNKVYNAYNASLISVNPKTGGILAMVGSADWSATSSLPEGCKTGTEKSCKFDPKVNLILSLRQPGSALKPFIYALAFQKGFTPDCVIWDVKTEFNPNCNPSAEQEKDKYGNDCYHPKDYDGKYRGAITFKNALAQSLNIPSVKVLYLVGINNALDFLEKFGITTLKERERYGLGLILGNGEVTLWELTSAYSVFANDGELVPFNFIVKIKDSKGKIIEENKKTPIRILENQIARQINEILSDNELRAPMFGSNSSLYFPDYEVAAKTGTTQFHNNGWVVGYSPNLITGVLVGNNDNSQMAKEPGTVLAGPIFHKFMEETLKIFPKENFKKSFEVLTGKSILDGQIKEPHSILYYLNKNNPLSEENSQDDSQFPNWEYGVQNYIKGL